MKKWIFNLALSGLCAQGFSQLPMFKTDAEITVAAKRFEEYAPHVMGKKIAVVGNHTSMVGELHLVDFLLSKGVEVVRVFAPEHGFRGTANAGELVADGRDERTGLPVVSLYGSHKKPRPEDLSGIEMVVFDIQDVGARFYTYISTMTYVMEACAENNVPLMVLDRPNPNGFYVDGPMLDPAFTSFVGMLPVPMVHGMTVAELARMINGEGWLKDSLKCELVVVSCEAYMRNDIYVLPLPPSPNLPNMNAVLLYPSLCLFEGTDISVGRGTDHPFEIFGHPNMRTGSYMFVPKPNTASSSPKHNGVPCLGWDLREIGGSRIREKQSIILDWVVNAYRDFPDKDKFFLPNNFFDKLAGTDELRLQIQAGMDADAIRVTWQADIAAFKARRAPYLLYL